VSEEVWIDPRWIRSPIEIESMKAQARQAEFSAYMNRLNTVQYGAASDQKGVVIEGEYTVVSEKSS